MPEELIKLWEDRADKCDKLSADQTNTYTTERLLAEADTYRLCADELRRIRKQAGASDKEKNHDI